MTGLGTNLAALRPVKKKKSLAYRLFVRLPFWAIVISVALVTLLKWMPVWYTPVMLKHSVQYRKVEDYHTRQKWVPIEQMSPALIQAAIASEDNRFCEHKGFDWEEMEKMFAQHQEKGKRIRGCSTISQQTAKNVFTWGSSTWARKIFEAYFTFLIEKIWGKERIMEVYLNVAEMGPGIYGAESAALHYFGCHASGLSRSQAVAIAVCLPNPLRYSPVAPGPYMTRRQAQIRALIPKVRYPDWVR